MSNRFPKSQRLCGQLRIRELYASGTKFTVWPLRITYAPAEETQVLIWAPKNLFHHAVDRNRLRRLMREAWRRNAAPLLESSARYQIAINYMDRKEQSYATIEKAMRKAIRRLTPAATDKPINPSTDQPINQSTKIIRKAFLFHRSAAEYIGIASIGIPRTSTANAPNAFHSVISPAFLIRDSKSP